MSQVQQCQKLNLVTISISSITAATGSSLPRSLSLDRPLCLSSLTDTALIVMVLSYMLKCGCFTLSEEIRQTTVAAESGFISVFSISP